MLKAISGLVEHSGEVEVEVEVSAEVVDAEEVRYFVDEDYVYV